MFKPFSSLNRFHVQKIDRERCSRAGRVRAIPAKTGLWNNKNFDTREYRATMGRIVIGGEVSHDIGT